MKKIILSSFFLLSLHFSLIAQVVNELPIQFQQFFRNYALLNPAASALEKRMEFYLADKSYTGEFGGVNKFCANFNYGLRNDTLEKKAKHILGGTFYNDKIGSYIGRSRAYLSYCMQIPLSYAWRLRAGASFGFVNYYYRASTLFPGRSIVSPTCDVGVWLNGNKWNLGISSNQLFSGNVSPYFEVVKLTRYYNFNLERIVTINPDFQLKPTFWLLYVNKGYYDANLALVGVIQNLISVGAAYKYQRGYTAYLGLERISIGSINLKWMASYYNRLRSSTSYEVQTVEISLFFQSNQSSVVTYNE